MKLRLMVGGPILMALSLVLMAVRGVEPRFFILLGVGAVALAAGLLWPRRRL